ncbi:MAG: replication factor C large subunit [Candidatus ainarchaeum sp.]|nr:replication factor C large subunit [Candidatus ainarchaeum sp.]
MSQLFTDKYFPKTIEEFIGNSEIVENALNWAEKWESGIKQKPLLFYGNSGNGKTTLAYLIAKKNDWQIFEMNSSDLRDKENIEKIMGVASQNSTLFSKKRLILIDEIDGLQAQDRGGASAIMTIIKNSNNPIILTANEVYSDKKLVPLRSLAELIEFKKINYLSIAKKLKEIATIENIEFEEDSLKLLGKNSEGDFRGALLDLQSLGKNVTTKDIEGLFARSKKEKIFSIMTKIFKGKTIKEINEAINNSETSSDLLLSWVDENIPRQYEGEDIAKAYEYFSKSDIYNGRIYKRQHYGFLKYVYFLSTVGVGLSKEKVYSGWRPFQFPSLISSLSTNSAKRKVKKEIAKKISKKTHCSEKQAIKDLPLIELYLTEKEKMSDYINYFEFSEEEMAYLLNTKKDTKKVEILFKDAKEKKEQIIIEKMSKHKQTTLF